MLAFGEEPVAAARALTGLHQGLVASCHTFKIIRMVVVITWNPDVNVSESAFKADSH